MKFGELHYKLQKKKKLYSRIHEKDIKVFHKKFNYAIKNYTHKNTKIL